jgi:hypothetical protein
MRADAIRTFPGGYHGWPGLERPLGGRGPPGVMATARTLLGLLGVAISVAGLIVAWRLEQFAGMALIVVGAFLLILPFTASTDEE